MGMKRFGYWKRYDRKYKKFDVKKLYFFILGKTRKLGEPFERKSTRGRPFALSPHEYVVLFIVSSLLDWSLRDDEFFSDILAGKHIDHSTFGKAFAKIPYHYLKKLLVMIRNTINTYLHVDPLLIADSTWVTVDRVYYETMTKCHRGQRRVREKLNVLTEYYPDEGIIVVANADSISSSDPFGASCMLQELTTNGGILFADRGYDAELLYEQCYRKKILPIIKIRRYNTNPRKYRNRAVKDFDEELYKKYRGIIEGIFGGLESRRLLFTRYKKRKMRIKHIIAMAIVHNLHTCMAILFFIQIYSTTSILRPVCNTPSFFIEKPRICNTIH